MLKAAVLAGAGPAEARYVQGELSDAGPAGPTTGKGSPSATGSYALALAALILGDEEEARERARSMSTGGEAFARTGEAIAALAAHDQSRYEVALAAIVGDFEQRGERKYLPAWRSPTPRSALRAGRRGAAWRWRSRAPLAAGTGL